MLQAGVMAAMRTGIDIVLRFFALGIQDPFPYPQTMGSRC